MTVAAENIWLLSLLLEQQKEEKLIMDSHHVQLYVTV